ncbi:MAG: discoidin domain-containing protein, partial [Pirellulales bacterium]|nr:discoidin domain-containing protein [Pirellulales bacterium]
WGEPVATGTWPNSPAEQVAIFPMQAGRYVRLRALSEVNGGPWTSIAELNILQAPQEPPPEPPANVRITTIATAPGENQVALTWDLVEGCHYYIYRADDPYALFPESWECLNPAAPVTGDTFTTTLQESDCWFRVTAAYD